MLGPSPVQDSAVKRDDESAFVQGSSKHPKHNQEQDVDDFDPLIITVTATSGPALARLIVVELRYLAGTCMVTRSW